MNAKDIKDGGPAFPLAHDIQPTEPGVRRSINVEEGMSLRDYFAAKAMHQFIAGAVLPPGFDATEQLNYVGHRAYEVADAMLRARERS